MALRGGHSSFNHCDTRRDVISNLKGAKLMLFSMSRLEISILYVGTCYDFLINISFLLTYTT